jgi:hypothetical protein
MHVKNPLSVSRYQRAAGRDVPRSVLAIEGAEDTTDLTTSKPTLARADPARRDGTVQLDFDKSISDGVPPCGIYSLRGDEADFTFPVPCSEPSTINSQPSTNQKLREYKCVYVLNDAEIGLFSGEVVVNCAPCFRGS